MKQPLQISLSVRPSILIPVNLLISYCWVQIKSSFFFQSIHVEIQTLGPSLYVHVQCTCLRVSTRERLSFDNGKIARIFAVFFCTPRCDNHEQKIALPTINCTPQSSPIFFCLPQNTIIVETLTCLLLHLSRRQFCTLDRRRQIAHRQKNHNIP